MKTILTITLALLATFSLAGAELTGTDLAGTWKGSMNTQMGETTVNITIKPGAAVTGTIQAGEYEAPLDKVKVSGDRISFEMKMAFGTVYYEGTVSGDTMMLDVGGTQGDKYKLTCTRQSGSK